MRVRARAVVRCPIILVLIIRACQAFCASNNFLLAGTEYGGECYCEISLAPPSVLNQSCVNFLKICSGNESK